MHVNYACPGYGHRVTPIKRRHQAVASLVWAGFLSLSDLRRDPASKSLIRIALCRRFQSTLSSTVCGIHQDRLRLHTSSRRPSSVRMEFDRLCHREGSLGDWKPPVVAGRG